MMIAKFCLIDLFLFMGLPTGFVVGFRFHTVIPEENFSTVNTFHTLKNRELPTVFVKMDTYTIY